MECDPALERRNVLKPAAIRRYLEGLTLSVISQAQKDKSCVIPLPWCPRRSHIHRDSKQMVGSECLMRTEFRAGR